MAALGVSRSWRSAVQWVLDRPLRGTLKGWPLGLASRERVLGVAGGLPVAVDAGLAWGRDFEEVTRVTVNETFHGGSLLTLQTPTATTLLDGTTGLESLSSALRLLHHRSTADATCRFVHDLPDSSPVRAADLADLTLEDINPPLDEDDPTDMEALFEGAEQVDDILHNSRTPCTHIHPSFNDQPDIAQIFSVQGPGELAVTSRSAQTDPSLARTFPSPSTASSSPSTPSASSTFGPQRRRSSAALLAGLVSGISTQTPGRNHQTWEPEPTVETPLPPAGEQTRVLISRIIASRTSSTAPMTVLLTPGCVTIAEFVGLFEDRQVGPRWNAFTLVRSEDVVSFDCDPGVGTVALFGKVSGLDGGSGRVSILGGV
ncbi:hypothetical protein HKX48_007263 [Thoreauomyces humboldtii]|nr:hypothetical protein HKX48_007263 [Thoreauomyces humboldtii]